MDGDAGSMKDPQSSLDNYPKSLNPNGAVFGEQGKPIKDPGETSATSRGVLPRCPHP